MSADRVIDPREFRIVVREEEKDEDSMNEAGSMLRKYTEVNEDRTKVDNDGLPPGNSPLEMVDIKEFIDEHELKERIRHNEQWNK